MKKETKNKGKQPENNTKNELPKVNIIEELDNLINKNIAGTSNQIVRGKEAWKREIINAEWDTGFGEINEECSRYHKTFLDFCCSEIIGAVKMPMAVLTTISGSWKKYRCSVCQEERRPTSFSSITEVGNSNPTTEVWTYRGLPVCFRCANQYNGPSGKEYRTKTRGEMAEIVIDNILDSRIVSYYQDHQADTKKILIMLKRQIENREAGLLGEIEKLTNEKETAEKERDDEKQKREIEIKAELEKKRTEQAQAQERKAEQDQILEQEQRALQSAEKVEIERLIAQRNQQETTLEAQNQYLDLLIEGFIKEKTRWGHREEQLKALVRKTNFDLEAIQNDKNSEIRILRIEAEQLRSDISELKIELAGKNTTINQAYINIERMEGEWETLTSQNIDYETAINKLNREKTQLETEKQELESENTRLSQKNKELKTAVLKEGVKAKIAQLSVIATDAANYLPVNKNWRKGVKAGIHASNAWLMKKNLPRLSYEGIIIFFGIILWYALLTLLRKVKKIIFGKSKSNLEQALEKVFTKQQKEPETPEAEILKVESIKTPEPNPQNQKIETTKNFSSLLEVNPKSPMAKPKKPKTKTYQKHSKKPEKEPEKKKQTNDHEV